MAGSYNQPSMDPLAALSAARAQGQQKSGPSLGDLAGMAAPFILQGLGGAKPPISPEGMTAAGLQPASTPGGTVLQKLGGAPITPSVDPLVQSGVLAQSAPVLSGLGAPGSISAIPQNMAQTPGLAQWLAQNQGSIIR